MLLRFVIFATLCFTGSAWAQSFPRHILDGLNARQSGNGIEVTWVMSRGVECLGIDVDRSVNGSPYERVFAIGGVCGSLDYPESYRFDDENLQASGQYSYILRFGNIGEAEVSAVFQLLWPSGISLIASGDGHQLRVEGLQDSYDVLIFSIEGKAMHESYGERQPEIFISTRSWPRGVYVIKVLSPAGMFSEKWALF